MVCILSKFVDDTKLGGVINVLENLSFIQNDLYSLEEWKCPFILRVAGNWKITKSQMSMCNGRIPCADTDRPVW